MISSSTLTQFIKLNIWLTQCDCKDFDFQCMKRCSFCKYCVLEQSVFDCKINPNKIRKGKIFINRQ